MLKMKKEKCEGRTTTSNMLRSASYTSSKKPLANGIQKLLSSSNKVLMYILINCKQVVNYYNLLYD